MKIVVCCKAVPGDVRDVTIAEDRMSIRYQGESFAMNACDEAAVDEAIALKRAHGGEVTILTVGPITVQDMLYVGLAKGADKAVRIDASLSDPQCVGRVLAAGLGLLSPDLILTGTQSRDTLAGHVGISVAHQLGLPYAYAVVAVEAIDPAALRVRKELGGGRYADIELRLPALLCVQTGIQPPTYVPQSRVARARQQPVRSMSLSDLGLDESDLRPKGYRFLSVLTPARAGRAQLIEGDPNEVAAILLAKITEAL